MRRIASPCHRMRGYLLIEALIALAIAAGILAALIALQLDLQRHARLAAERGFAAGWAEHSGEALLGRIRAGDDPNMDAGDHFWPTTAITDPAQSPPGYWKRWSVTPAPAPLSMPDLSTIEVVVTWPHPDSDPLRRLHWRSTAATASAAESARASAATPAELSP